MTDSYEDTFTILISSSVQTLDDTLAVLSSRKLCDERGPTYERASSKQPRLTKQGKKHFCKTQNFRNYVRSWIVEFIFYIFIEGVKYIIQVQFQGEVTGSHQKTGRGIPQGTGRIRMTVCEIFQNDWGTLKKIPRIQKCLQPHAFLMNQNSERRTKVATRKHSILSSLPKAPKLRYLLANQNYKNSLQKIHWRSSTSSRKER